MSGRPATDRHRSRPIAPTGPIGIFDSGIGGGTVLRHLHRLLPAEDLLFLADQANCPYGSRSVEEIRTLSATNTRWLLARDAKLIVVACNTASAGALHRLRRTFPDVAFVGMVPAVKPAARRTESGVVGVLATPATIQGDLLRDVVDHWADGVEVVSQVCHGLVERIEAGHLDTVETQELLERCLAPLLDAGADTIVLGCTHYPYVLPHVERIAGPHVTILDAAPAVARQVRRVLHERNLAHPDPERSGTVRYATSGDALALSRLVAQFQLPSGTVTAVTGRHGDTEPRSNG